ncbi:Os04g0566750, partial [Oryza sativa Japonica Group]
AATVLAQPSASRRPPTVLSIPTKSSATTPSRLPYARPREPHWLRTRLPPQLHRLAALRLLRRALQPRGRPRRPADEVAAAGVEREVLATGAAAAERLLVEQELRRGRQVVELAERDGEALRLVRLVRAPGRPAIAVGGLVGGSHGGERWVGLGFR